MFPVQIRHQKKGDKLSVDIDGDSCTFGSKTRTIRPGFTIGREVHGQIFTGIGSNSTEGSSELGFYRRLMLNYTYTGNRIICVGH